MRLSELLHAGVVDSAGAEIGSVDDVYLVQDGPLLLPFGAAFRVEGLVIGHSGVGTRLGFARGPVKGPWLIKRLLGGLERRAHYAAWAQVASWDGDRVQLSVPVDQLGPPTVS